MFPNLLKNIFIRKNKLIINSPTTKVHFLVIAEYFATSHKITNDFAVALSGQLNLFTLPLHTNNISLEKNPSFIYNPNLEKNGLSSFEDESGLLYAHDLEAIEEAAKDGISLIIPCFSLIEMEIIKEILLEDENNIVETIFIGLKTEDKKFVETCKNNTDFFIKTRKEPTLKSFLLNIILSFFPQTVQQLKINDIDSKQETLQDQFISKVSTRQKQNSEELIDMI